MAARVLQSTATTARIHTKLACRTFSSTSNDDFVLTTLDEGIGMATLQLNRPPVNSLSLEMLQAISTSLKSIESNPEIQSLVISSCNPKVFSAGLDITELYTPNVNRLRKFWYAFQQVYLDLYGSRLACIAAIEGHAPAAGCMLALCCDYRIMTDNSRVKIGLNETELGIAAPPWLGKMLVDTIGTRQAELSLGLGLLYSWQQALKMGLVDEVVSTEDVVERAKDEAVKWAGIPPQARVASKLLTRRAPMDHLRATRQQDTDDFVSFVTLESTQQTLGAYLERLKSKSK